jgi:hypothetical protein
MDALSAPSEEGAMTNEHAHEWQPVAEQGQYICSCGATGYRFSYRAGGILAHKVPRAYGVSGQVAHVNKSNRTIGGARLGRRGPGGW